MFLRKLFLYYRIPEKDKECLVEHQVFLVFHSFPDMKVREMAVGWIRELSNDELIDYLPQLLQAMKHETYEASPLTRFLLERALFSPRVAHHIYWLLTQALPGQSPQVQVG